MTTPFTETDEGFYQGRAIVTCVGVFSYRNADNSVTRELRLPEEVFSHVSLESMNGKPVTNNHPRKKVTADNAKKYQVGSIGTDPSSYIDSWAARRGYNDEGERGSTASDGFHVAVTLTITNADAIADVKSGKTALSMGYTCDIEDAPAGSVWCGMAYECVQRNIRYNHVAIVDKARAGDAARIRMDGDDAIQIENEGASPNPKQGENSMKKIKIDGVDYEGEDGLIKSYQEEKKRADSAEAALVKADGDSKSELSKMEAERDNHKDRADKLDAEIKKLREQSLDPKRLDEAVKARVELLDAAIKAGVEVADGISDVEIRKAVITKVYPEAKLDGRDDAYINGRFDSAVEELRKDADSSSRQFTSDLPPAGNREDSDYAYRRMVDYQKALSRGEAKE